MTDCPREEEVKDPYPMTTSCFLQIHVVQVNQDHQTETEIVLKMLDSSNRNQICFHHQCDEMKLTRAKQADIPPLIALCCFQLACSIENHHLH